jgi:muramidase (phage lysozyme)
MNPVQLIALAILGIAGYFVAREVSASSMSVPRLTVFPENNFDPQVTVTIPDVPSMSDEEYARILIEKGYDPREFGFDVPGEITVTEPIGNVPPPVIPAANSKEANLAAFLALIRELESGNNYYALVYGGNFSDTSDHPYNLGWRTGKPSHAAGAYQIQPGTMREVQTRFNVPKGFTPEIQDQLAIGILQLPWRQGAYFDVLNGNFNSAFQKLRQEWEAFDRIVKGDYHFTFEQAKQFYANAGGSFA